MNVLLTSSGRRGYMVNYFKKVFNPIGGKVHTCNSERLCSSFKAADAYIVAPKIYDDGYIDFILSYCADKNIKLIVPLFDVDLLILAKYKSIIKSHGITVVVSNEEVVRICNDKWSTYKFLKSQGVAVPRSFIDVDSVIKANQDGILAFPLMLKPRWGMGSIGIRKIHSVSELKFFDDYVKTEIKNSYLKYESAITPDQQIIYQEYIEGDEYGLDIVNDLNSNYYFTYVKRKLAMRSGETDIAVYEDNKDLRTLGQEIASSLKHIGNLDMDVITSNGLHYVLDLNARFGGGYPFTHALGVDLPRLIMEWVLQIKPTDFKFKDLSNDVFFKDIIVS
ncbi:ATP-grasp domain-containing protein [Winogradskyella aurantiaca]|uniref:ATP-grasp domain-containing protein n=1 Tax=Winogradskyella aurantiaca TaxID=2219558 RepID=UPI000E1C709B|nr:ATP-grasp domain-containing protein [Winogradskyella aurantiaca]